MNKKYSYLIILILTLSQSTFGKTITISGKVTDNKQPLQYVSIGIINNTIGTVSNKYGSFTLKLNEDQVSENDTLRFSMIGYKSKSFSVLEIKNNLSLNVQLSEKIETIPEAVITSKKLKVKKHGTTHYILPLAVQLAMSEYPDQNLGSEIGRSFNINHQNTILKNFKFYIYANNYDTITFRINVYSVKNRRPFKNILSQNIFIEVSGRKTKWITVDLKPYNIHVDKDIIVSLEWVAKSKKGNTLIFPLARPSTATHYYKYGSQNKWKRFEAMSSLMKLTLKY